MVEEGLVQEVTPQWDWRWGLMEVVPWLQGGQENPACSGSLSQGQGHKENTHTDMISYTGDKHLQWSAALPLAWWCGTCSSSWCLYKDLKGILPIFADKSKFWTNLKPVGFQMLIVGWVMSELISWSCEQKLPQGSDGICLVSLPLAECLAHRRCSIKCLLTSEWGSLRGHRVGLKWGSF